jgi:cytochrome b561
MIRSVIVTWGRSSACGTAQRLRLTVAQEDSGGNAGVQAYGTTARLLHWLMAVLVIIQVTAGLIMLNAAPPSLLATLADTLALYSVHKVLGLVLLALALIRIAWRVARGAPPEEPTLAVWQRETSRLVHAWIYLALILVPILGWVGISLYPALVVFDSFAIPGLTAPDEARSVAVFAAHAIAAFALVALVAMHVGAALYHHFIRGDGVLLRMLPGLRTTRRN